MDKTRSPKELFNIVIKYHSYFNSNSPTPYMCQAADRAYLAGKITEPECHKVQQLSMKLVDSFSERAATFEGALREAKVIGACTPYEYVRYIVKDLWNEYFKTLENQDE